MADSQILKNQIKGRDVLRHSNTVYLSQKGEDKKLKQEKQIKMTKCELCQKPFTLMNREHKCKRCFKSVCINCANEKRLIIGYGIKPTEKHKVCILCAQDSIGQENIRKDHYLSWGKDSDLCKDWINKLGIFQNIMKNTNIPYQEQYELISAGLEYQFEQELQKISQIQSSESYSQLSEILIRVLILDILFKYSLIMYLLQNELIKNTYMNNASFVEMLHYVTKDISEQQIINDVGDVLTAFIVTNGDQIGFSNQMINLALFLLIYCSPAKAYIIMNQIYKEIIPDFLWPKNFKNGGERSLYKLIQYYNELLVNELKIETSLMPRVRRYLELEGINLFQSLFAIFLNFDSNHLLFSMIVLSEDKYSMTVKSLLALISYPKNIESMILLGPDDPLIISEFINNTTRYYLNTAIKKMKFPIKNYNHYNIQSNIGGISQDPNAEIEHLRSEISVLKSRNKRILQEMTGNQYGDQDDEELQNVLEELFQKDKAIAELQLQLQEKGAFDESDEDSEDSDNTINNNKMEIQQMIIALKNLKDELSDHNLLKDIYLTKFNNIHNSLEILFKSDTQGKSKQLTSIQEIKQYLQDPADLLEKKNKIKDLEVQIKLMQNEKQEQEKLIQKSTNQLLQLQQNCENIRLQVQNKPEDSKERQIMNLEEELFEEQQSFLNFKNQIKNDQGKQLSELNQSLILLQVDYQEKQKRLQLLTEQNEEWKQKAQKYQHLLNQNKSKKSDEFSSPDISQKGSNIQSGFFSKKLKESNINVNNKDMQSQQQLQFDMAQSSLYNVQNSNKESYDNQEIKQYDPDQFLKDLQQKYCPNNL